MKIEFHRDEHGKTQGFSFEKTKSIDKPSKRYELSKTHHDNVCRNFESFNEEIMHISNVNLFEILQK